MPEKYELIVHERPVVICLWRNGREMITSVDSWPPKPEVRVACPPDWVIDPSIRPRDSPDTSIRIVVFRRSSFVSRLHRYRLVTQHPGVTLEPVPLYLET